MEIPKGLQEEILSVQNKLKNAIRDHQVSTIVCIYVYVLWICTVCSRVLRKRSVLLFKRVRKGLNGDRLVRFRLIIIVDALLMRFYRLIGRAVKCISVEMKRPRKRGATFSCV